MDFERVREINTKEDLAEFIKEFIEELSTRQDEWENQDLYGFLSAMESWIRSIDMYAKNSGDIESTIPSWRTFAKILSASKIYE